MANIQLKTLKFPGLNDKYIIPEVYINDVNKDGNVKMSFGIPVRLIKFYVNWYGETIKEFTAIEGMNFPEWVNSSYNPSDSEIGWSESMEDVVPYIYYDSNYTPPGFIEANHTYYTL